MPFGGSEAGRHLEAFDSILGHFTTEQPQAGCLHCPKPLYTMVVSLLFSIIPIYPLRYTLSSLYKLYEQCHPSRLTMLLEPHKAWLFGVLGNVHVNQQSRQQKASRKGRRGGTGKYCQA